MATAASIWVQSSAAMRIRPANRAVPHDPDGILPKLWLVVEWPPDAAEPGLLHPAPPGPKSGCAGLTRSLYSESYGNCSPSRPAHARPANAHTTVANAPTSTW